MLAGTVDSSNQETREFVAGGVRRCTGIVGFSATEVEGGRTDWDGVVLIMPQFASNLQGVFSLHPRYEVADRHPILDDALARISPTRWTVLAEPKSGSDVGNIGNAKRGRAESSRRSVQRIVTVVPDGEVVEQRIRESVILGDADNQRIIRLFKSDPGKGKLVNLRRVVDLVRRFTVERVQDVLAPDVVVYLHTPAVVIIVGDPTAQEVGLPVLVVVQIIGRDVWKKLLGNIGEAARANYVQHTVTAELLSCVGLRRSIISCRGRIVDTYGSETVGQAGEITLDLSRGRDQGWKPRLRRGEAEPAIVAEYKCLVFSNWTSTADSKFVLPLHRNRGVEPAGPVHRVVFVVLVGFAMPAVGPRSRVQGHDPARRARVLGGELFWTRVNSEIASTGTGW